MHDFILAGAKVEFRENWAENRYDLMQSGASSWKWRTLKILMRSQEAWRAQHRCMASCMRPPCQPRRAQESIVSL